MRLGLVKGLYIVVVSMAFHIEGGDSSNVEKSFNEDTAGAAQSIISVVLLVFSVHGLHLDTRSEAHERDSTERD